MPRKTLKTQVPPGSFDYLLEPPPPPREPDRRVTHITIVLPPPPKQVKQSGGWGLTFMVLGVLFLLALLL